MAPDYATACSELAALGRWLDARAWTPATSSNLSARLDDGSVAITASGRHKGELGLHDFLRVGVDGQVLQATPGDRPSAETALHLLAYRQDPGVGAVVHVHSPAAACLSRQAFRAIELQGWELLKALSGTATHDTSVTIPVFDNDQDMDALAERVAAAWPDPGWGLVLRGHGLYAWGSDIAAARRHAEALETLFDYELRLGGAR